MVMRSDSSWFEILRMGGSVTSTSTGTKALFNNKNLYGWYLKDAVQFDKPIPYKHPQGAQMWVIIPEK